MATYSVTIPIAGHAYVEVEADNEKEAINRAMEIVGPEHLESWEALHRFNQGNICYCPQPWEPEAEKVDG